MGFRVVDESSFTFKTDLPPSSRNIHPSGVLHAFRITPPNPMSSNSSGREEHAFVWINNVIHAEEALKHMESCGFDRSRDVVFIPYSTKQNWLDRYPHAAPAMETTESGKVVVYLNWRPYPNGLGELGQNSDSLNGAVSAATAASREKNNVEGNDQDQSEGGTIDSTKEVKKRKVGRPRKAFRDRTRPSNMFKDEECLPDAERDELHVEIYNYFMWLYSKLEQKLEEKTKKSESVGASKASEALIDEEDMEEDEGDNEDDDDKAITGKRKPYKKSIMIPGVDLAELQGLVSKMETSFMVIANIKLDKAGKKEPENAEGQKGVPFLEEALSNALKQLVAAREAAGEPKRRSRKRRSNIDGSKTRWLGDWDKLFQRLVQYKEKHGDCCVSKNTHDKQLYNWIHRVRERKVHLAKEGLEFETVPEGGKMFARTLTEERLAQLNSIGFTWAVLEPKVAWEVRFQEMMDYYEENGKWPSQSMGSLGLWVHKQRQSYKKGSKKFMETKAPQLDEVGFEWTPRGNTRMSWDEGFELLMEFGRQNGHFNVPCPIGSNVDKKSEAYRLYNWVESLHMMYRSYKLGRQSGSLTEERVVLLMNQGFEFRHS